MHLPLYTRDEPRAEYLARINRVIDHVQAHLDEPLDLERLAGVACFSAFHFHRLFRSLVGETLHQFVHRLRLQRAAWQLHHNPRKPITDIALDCGFSSSATFARAFRDFHGRSASDFRKIGKADRKPRKAGSPGEGPDWDASGNPAPFQESPMTATLFPLQVQVQDLPPMTVAYIRHIGPYKGNSELFGRLFGELCAWAGPRGLIHPGATFMSLYHDDPDMTPEANLRMEVGLTIPDDTPVEGAIGKLRLAGGPCAVARVEILPHQYEAVWQSLMAGWLPGSGYQPDDHPCMELYRNDPKAHPEGRHILDLCLPVKPL